MRCSGPSAARRSSRLLHLRRGRGAVRGCRGRGARGRPRRWAYPLEPVDRVALHAGSRGQVALAEAQVQAPALHGGGHVVPGAGLPRFPPVDGRRHLVCVDVRPLSGTVDDRPHRPPVDGRRHQAWHRMPVQVPTARPEVSRPVVAVGVRVEDRSGQAAPQVEGGFDGVLDQFGAHVVAHRPAGDPPVPASSPLPVATPRCSPVHDHRRRPQR